MQNEIIFSNNKAEIIISDNKQGTCMSIDVAVPADRNAIKKETEIILKYKDLTLEIQHMWNVKAKLIYDIFVNCNWVVTQPQVFHPHSNSI